MSEIMDVERLRQRCAAGESFKYLYFWGHRPATDDKVGKSCFSQWYEASFKLDGVRYPQRRALHDGGQGTLVRRP